jgi:hypothetical protein
VITLILAADEPSKIPFYIAGGLFVVWAVALAGVGLTRPAFPVNARAYRGVMAVSLVLAVASMATGVITSSFPK